MQRIHEAIVGATGCADGCGKLSGNVNQLSSAPHLCTTSQFDFVTRLLKGFQMEEEIEDDWLFLAAAAACVNIIINVKNCSLYTS